MGERRYEREIESAVRGLAASLDTAVSLEALADRAALSPFHFHRLFRAMVGETPVELVRRLRLERAAWQLDQTDASVGEIAFDAGYQTHEAFSKAFRSAFKLSPSEFRAQGRATHGLPNACRTHFRSDGLAVEFRPIRTGEITMHYEIVEMPRTRVAALAHSGPYHQLGHTFSKLFALAGPAGLVRGAPTTIAFYYDDPDSTDEADLRAHAGLLIPDDTALPPELEEVWVEPGRFLRATHMGPYSGLGHAWSEVYGQIIPQSGVALRNAPCFEMYLNDCQTVPPEEVRTDIYVAVE